MTDKKRVFEKHPVITISIIVLVIILFFDLILGIIFIPKDYNNFRKPHEYYHHTLEPNKAVMAK